MTFSHDVQIHFLSNQKGIVLHLHTKGMSLDAVHEDLVRVRVLGQNAVVYSTVTKYVRSEKFPPKNDRHPSEPMTVEPGPIDQAILTALADYPFSSVRKLSPLTCLLRSTVHGAQAPDWLISFQDSTSAMDPPFVES
jgi:hypothetical protein